MYPHSSRAANANTKIAMNIVPAVPLSGLKRALRACLPVAPPPPLSAVGAELKALVEKLSAQTGSVPFNPHVTVLTGLEGDEAEVVAAVKKAAESVSPIEVNFTKAVAGEAGNHWQCVYFRVEENVSGGD